MPRILGIDIPRNKQIQIALRYIHGLGPTMARQVAEKAGVEPAKRASDLTDDEIQSIARVLQTEYTVEGDLRREVMQNIRRLVSIQSYRGRRHRMGLPVRGQRTSTNARTRKGPKRTVGAIRGKEARSAAKQTLK